MIFDYLVVPLRHQKYVGQMLIEYLVMKIFCKHLQDNKWKNDNSIHWNNKSFDYLNHFISKIYYC